MSEKIILIDGHSILNRAFYGVPLLTGEGGIHTNAVYGFLNILFRILDEEQAQYLAVAFDMKAPTFRHKIYAEYKGTRKAMPEELKEQVPLIKEVLGAMNIPLMMLEGYEADDLIGTVSLKAAQSGMEVRIVSGDRDLLQLASDSVCVRMPRTKQGKSEVEDFFAKDVLEQYKVTPAQIIDLKALMGDASDNIPGIPGVGEKTAAKIIASYGTIENAYEHRDEITPPRARTSLSEHYDLAQLSKTLATIDRHSPFELDLEAARIGDIYTPKALELCKKLGFRSMLTRFEGKESPAGKKLDVRIIRDKAALESFEQELESGWKEDWQRAGLSAPGGAVSEGIWAIALTPEKAVCIVCGSTLAAEEDRIGSGQAAAFVKKICEKAGSVSAVNLKSQLALLDPGDGRFETEHYEDPAVGAYLINPLSGDYPYDMIAREYAGLDLKTAQELTGKKVLAGLDEESKEAALCECAGSEALTAFLSPDRIREKLTELEMWELYRNIEMPLLFILYRMEKEGIAVRGEELHAFSARLQERISLLEKQVYEQAGEEFNINSPKQLGVILFEKMGMPFGKKTKTGYSTSADILEKLADSYPFVSDILEYRQLTKLRSTYAEGLGAFIAPDGRIHGRFNQTVTATGRISSADPNLQNIPVRTELGRELRKVFVPAKGKVFVDADYSQIELRVLAHMSGDEKLIEAYRQAQDIHSITASQVFQIPLDQVDDLHRRNAKAVNFGIVYGISSFGLSQGLSISRQEAAEYIEQYFRTYPGIKEFLDGLVESAKQTGYARTMFGRRRPVPELKESNFMRRSFGERVAMNSPIQGTAADIIKIAMIRVDERLYREGLRSRLILQVHDELLVETWPDELEQVEKILREEMMGAVALKVDLEIDMHAGESWYDAK